MDVPELNRELPGVAPGILAAVALTEDREPGAVGYPPVREELLRQNYRLSE